MVKCPKSLSRMQNAKLISWFGHSLIAEMWSEQRGGIGGKMPQKLVAVGGGNDWVVPMTHSRCLFVKWRGRGVVAGKGWEL